MNHRIIAFFLLLLGVSACDPSFDPGSRVLTFRVLAQQLDKPAARPGEEVNLTSLSYEPQGRPVTWAWAACINPASSSVTGCIDRIVEQATLSGELPILAQGLDMSSFSYTIPEDALDSLPESSLSTASVGLVSIACPGDLSLTPGANGFPFRCLEAGTNDEMPLDQYVIGLKRVQVRTEDRNENPLVEQVTFDGEPWAEDDVKEVSACDTGNDYDACSESTRHRIAAIPSSASIESGRTQFGKDFAEQVIIQYYATEGVFEYEIKIADEPETHWAARIAASGEDVTLWMVLHDDRGGASWVQRTVHVQ